MKKAIKLPGITIFTAIIMFSFAACGGGGGGPGPIPEPEPEPTPDEIDFGVGVTPTVYDCTSADLEDTFSGISAAGNYVINVTGDVTLSSGTPLEIHSSDVVISLRGTGSNSITADEYCLVALIENTKLILRDITLYGDPIKFDGVVSCRTGSTLIMESGSVINGGCTGVYVIGGSFIMNSGVICGSEGDGGVYIRESDSYFEKKSGAIIYGNDGGSKSNINTLDNTGHAVTVRDTTGYNVLAYRDNTIGAGETISITLDDTGDGIASESGTWQH